MIENVGRLGDRLLEMVVPQVKAAAQSCTRVWSGQVCYCCCPSGTGGINCTARGYTTCNGYC